MPPCSYIGRKSEGTASMRCLLLLVAALFFSSCGGLLIYHGVEQVMGDSGRNETVFTNVTIPVLSFNFQEVFVILVCHPLSLFDSRSSNV